MSQLAWPKGTSRVDLTISPSGHQLLPFLASAHTPSDAGRAFHTTPVVPAAEREDFVPPSCSLSATPLRTAAEREDFVPPSCSLSATPLRTSSSQATSSVTTPGHVQQGKSVSFADPTAPS
eukprot:154037-Amphidinium_carterae.1